MKKYILTIVLLFSTICLNVFAQAKSYPFEVVKSGSGKQAILFIPGFASSGDVWNETKAAFEKDFSCYTLTMAGFAGVEPQPNPSFENWKTAIARYIKDNKIEKPIIIGHSMGGGLALAIAADYPELAGRIVVVDAFPALAAAQDASFKSVENIDCSPVVNQITAMSESQFYDMQKMSVARLSEDVSKHDLIVDWSVKSDKTTFAQMYCDFSNTDLRDRIATIKCPSLILLEGYFVNLKPVIEQQYKKLTTAQLQYANKGLHFIMYDDTDWYLEQLNNFIKTK
jgi:pimeloyl-ACP methyl ester carboxylesterase